MDAPEKRQSVFEGIPVEAETQAPQREGASSNLFGSREQEGQANLRRQQQVF